MTVGLGPEAAHEVDLLLEPSPAVREVLAQRLVLHRVPADPHAEPEPTRGEHVDFRGLLRDERGLALRQDDDPGDELRRGDRGQVAEHHERLMERRVDVVGTAPVLMNLRVGAHDVVVRQDVGVTELLDPFAVRAHRAHVAAELGLGEHHADAHCDLPSVEISGAGGSGR